MHRTAILILSSLLMLSLQLPKEKVLIIGDSISMGYTPFVREALKDKADVVHNPGNAQHTGVGLRSLDKWLGKEKWNVIHFNWGLWDLCYRHFPPKQKDNRDKVNGRVTFSVEQYAANLDSLVTRLKATGATLIFATTTVVPSGEPGRFEGEEKKYNKAALAIMKKHGVKINDLNRISYKIHAAYGLGEGDVHFSSQGYEELSRKVIRAIRKTL